MDKTTKFILGLIAVALIGINIQMWNGKTGLIKPAYAVGGNGTFNSPLYIRCLSVVIKRFLFRVLRVMESHSLTP